MVQLDQPHLPNDREPYHPVLDEDWEGGSQDEDRGNHRPKVLRAEGKEKLHREGQDVHW